MLTSRRHLPSTTSLVAFETAARHGSCSGAAAELALTVGAISKQIRALEEAVGVPLFARTNQGLVLTESGRVYLESIHPLLTQLAAAATKAITAHQTRRTLMLRVFPALAERWLLPRFADFVERHPDIDVQFTTYLSSDRMSSSVDAGLRFGTGTWPDQCCDYLLGREVVLVCSPAYLERHGAIKSAAQVFDHTLLHHIEVPDAWREFRKAHRVRGTVRERFVRYDYYSVLIRAAVSGMGVALIPDALIREELRSGVLVSPGPLRHVSRSGYYVVYPESKKHDPALMQLRQWLLEVAAEPGHGREVPTIGVRV